MNAEARHGVLIEPFMKLYTQIMFLSDGDQTCCSPRASMDDSRDQITAIALSPKAEQ